MCASATYRARRNNTIIHQPHAQCSLASNFIKQSVRLREKKKTSNVDVSDATVHYLQKQTSTIWTFPTDSKDCKIFYKIWKKIAKYIHFPRKQSRTSYKLVLAAEQVVAITYSSFRSSKLIIFSCLGRLSRLSTLAPVSMFQWNNISMVSNQPLEWNEQLWHPL